MAGAFRDEVIRKIEESHAEYTRISDEIWGYAEPRFQEEQSSRPVSYTHLDVYTRQGGSAAMHGADCY